jgi:hypothetical protein
MKREAAPVQIKVFLIVNGCGFRSVALGQNLPAEMSARVTRETW